MNHYKNSFTSAFIFYTVGNETGLVCLEFGSARNVK